MDIKDAYKLKAFGTYFVEVDTDDPNTIKKYKQVKFRLSSWNKLRRKFYGRYNENFSDYIERLAKHLEGISVKKRIGK